MSMGLAFNCVAHKAPHNKIWRSVRISLVLENVFHKLDRNF